MAFDNMGPIQAIQASTDLSAKQFQCVSINTSGQLAITSDAGAADGILLDKPNAQNVLGNVVTQPGIVVRAAIGATVATAGLQLEVASGKLVPHSAGKVVAISMSAGASGDIQPVLLVLQR